MTRCRVFLGAALAVMFTSASLAQTLSTPQADPLPTFRPQVWGSIVADFSTRVQNYFDLRSTLEEGLPPFRVTDDVAEIRRVRRALARALGLHVTEPTRETSSHPPSALNSNRFLPWR